MLHVKLQTFKAGPQHIRDSTNKSYTAALSEHLNITKPIIDTDNCKILTHRKTIKETPTQEITYIKSTLN